MRGGGGESNPDERPTNQRLRPGNGGLRGGGQPGEVRRRYLNRGANEQDDRQNRGLPDHRRRHLRRRSLRRLLHRRRRGHPPRHPRPRRGGGDGVQRPGPASGGGLRHKKEA